MSHSVVLEMNGLELIGSLPSKGILELFSAAMWHCLFIHKTPTNCDRSHSRWHCERWTLPGFHMACRPSIGWCRLTWWEDCVSFYTVCHPLGSVISLGPLIWLALSFCWGNSIKRIWMMWVFFLLYVFGSFLVMTSKAGFPFLVVI